MDTVESLNHSVWDCKYHVVFIPKCRRKTLYGDLRQYPGEVFRRLAQQKGSRIRGRPSPRAPPVVRAHPDSVADRSALSDAGGAKGAASSRASGTLAGRHGSDGGVRALVPHGRRMH